MILFLLYLCLIKSDNGTQYPGGDSFSYDESYRFLNLSRTPMRKETPPSPKKNLIGEKTCEQAFLVVGEATWWFEQPTYRPSR